VTVGTVALVLAQGCDAPPPPLDLTVAVSREDAGTFAHAPIRLYRDGRPVATPAGPAIDVPLGKWHPTDPEPNFTAEMDLPCGPATLPVETRGLIRSEDPGSGISGHVTAREEPKTFQRYVVQVKRPAGLTFNLWIDNRGGPARTAAIGKFTFEIPADYAGANLAAPVPGCAEGAALTIDGHPAGSIPLDLRAELVSYEWSSDDPQESIERHSRNFLLDVSGSRCYEFRQRTYKEVGYTLQAPWLGGEQAWSWKRGHLHRLIPGDVDHFLTQAPEKFQFKAEIGDQVAARIPQDWAHLSTRIQLTEIPCR
jgi:hypothetical protein